MSSARQDWQRRVRGEACPMDAPRPDSNDSWDLIAKLSVSSLYLSKDQTYRGRCVVIFDLRHAARSTRRAWARSALNNPRAPSASAGSRRRTISS